MQTQIGEITKIINGFPFKSSDFNSDGKGLLIIRIQDMEKGINNNSKFWDGVYDKKVLINKGDILVSLSGSFKVEKWEFSEALLNQRIIKIATNNNENLLNGYLYYYLNQKLDEIKSKATNTSIPNISVNDIKNLQIPLPPLSTQKQIIQKLDKLKELISLRKESIKKQEYLIKSIFIEMFGDPMLNEKGWEVKKLGELCNKITDGEHNNPDFTNEGMPLIMAKDVLDYGIDLSDVKYVSFDDGVKYIKKCNPQKGDLLIVSRGATIGRITVVNLNISFCTMGSTILIKPNFSIIYSKYIMYLFRDENFIKKVRNVSSASAQQAIYIANISNLKIPVPPISLQNKFASIVQKNEENIKKQKESLEKLEELYSTTMQESFRF
ncbi:MAG: restriction endonuclease subunit S [Candidatus Gracilibacteria bacterium]|nr:restriction endonuclease subunit S [Candidatus Gracilibacteria bacterium]